MSTDLIELDPAPLAPTHETQALAPTNPIAPLLSAVVAKGITSENVEALSKLADLYSRMEAQRAEREFAAAFARLQASIPAIEATRAVPDRNGAVRFTFAPYEEIMRAVQPVLAEHGFSLSFNMEQDGARLIAACTLTHSGGFSRTNRFGVRIGNGPPQTNEAQADGSARSYAKRYALCDCLNIIIDRDSDARSEGDVIDPATATKLEEAVRQLVLDPAKVLKLADAPSFDQIREAKLPVIEKILAEKRAEQRLSAPAPAASSRDFADPGAWRDAMVEEFARRGAKNPGAAFDASLAKGGYSSYLDVPPFRRGVAWDALKAGKLDGYLK